MADDATNGAAEERIEGADADAKSSQNAGITEDQISKLLEERDRKWQSRMDKILAEKKETETKSKTAEERIAEIERKYESERLSRVREHAINSVHLDPSVFESAKMLLDNDEESITNGAAKMKEFLDGIVERRVREGLEKEIDKRFAGGEKPKGGNKTGELSYADVLEMDDEQIKALPRGVFEQAMSNK
jgi:hypothetical protein